LMIDRYEIGERQTSACGIPTPWLEALALEGALQQTFPELVIHTPHGSARFDLPWSFSTFDYRTLCELLAEQGSFGFETAAVINRNRTGSAHVPPRRPEHVPAGAGAHAPRPKMIEVETDRG